MLVSGYLLCSVKFCLFMLASCVRPEIGFYPLKGNMYRAKFDNEIDASASFQFQDFVRRNGFTKAMSEATNNTYWVSENGISFYGFDQETDLCIHTIENENSNGKNKKIKMYFLCDAYCCADECCDRDWPLTIIGIGCISLFVIIPLYCLLSCICAKITTKKANTSTVKNNNNIEYTGIV